MLSSEDLSHSWAMQLGQLNFLVETWPMYFRGLHYFYTCVLGFYVGWQHWECHFYIGKAFLKSIQLTHLQSQILQQTGLWHLEITISIPECPILMTGRKTETNLEKKCIEGHFSRVKGLHVSECPHTCLSSCFISLLVTDNSQQTLQQSDLLINIFFFFFQSSHPFYTLS